jgi:hypothetical protein
VRPGELLDVYFELDSHPEGIWVPVRAIRWTDEKTSVFVVESGSDEVREVEVSVVGEPVDELRRIEGDFPEKSKIVVEGVAFVSDGERVRVVEGAQ